MTGVSLLVTFLVILSLVSMWNKNKNKHGSNYWGYTIIMCFFLWLCRMIHKKIFMAEFSCSRGAYRWFIYLVSQNQTFELIFGQSAVAVTIKKCIHLILDSHSMFLVYMNPGWRFCLANIVWFPERYHRIACFILHICIDFLSTYICLHMIQITSKSSLSQSWFIPVPFMCLT